MFYRRWTYGFLFGVMFSGLGCADYKWRFNYEEAAALASKEQKTLFIYYRHWLSADCTRMYDEVLNKPDVAKLFQDTVNCQLEYSYEPNRQVMAKYGVQSVPAYVILKPDGEHVARTGVMSKDRFLAFARVAEEGGAQQANPTTKAMVPAVP